MDNGILPEDGAALVGSVALPAGQRVYAEERGKQLVAWVTSEPMADAGSAWWLLSGAQAETGLIPVTLAPPIRGDWNSSRLWWDDFGFWCPEDGRGPKMPPSGSPPSTLPSPMSATA
jgi:hypothetical protein